MALSPKSIVRDRPSDKLIVNSVNVVEIDNRDILSNDSNRVSLVSAMQKTTSEADVPTSSTSKIVVPDSKSISFQSSSLVVAVGDVGAELTNDPSDFEGKTTEYQALSHGISVDSDKVVSSTKNQVGVTAIASKEVAKTLSPETIHQNKPLYGTTANCSDVGIDSALENSCVDMSVKLSTLELGNSKEEVKASADTENGSVGHYELACRSIAANLNKSTSQAIPDENVVKPFEVEEGEGFNGFYSAMSTVRTCHSPTTTQYQSLSLPKNSAVVENIESTISEHDKIESSILSNETDLGVLPGTTFSLGSAMMNDYNPKNRKQNEPLVDDKGFKINQECNHTNGNTNTSSNKIEMLSAKDVCDAKESKTLLNETTDTISETTDKLNDTTDKLNDTTDKLNDTTDKLNETTDKLNETTDSVNTSDTGVTGVCSKSNTKKVVKSNSHESGLLNTLQNQIKQFQQACVDDHAQKMNDQIHAQQIWQQHQAEQQNIELEHQQQYHYRQKQPQYIHQQQQNIQHEQEGCNSNESNVSTTYKNENNTAGLMSIILDDTDSSYSKDSTIRQQHSKQNSKITEEYISHNNNSDNPSVSLGYCDMRKYSSSPDDDWSMVSITPELQDVGCNLQILEHQRRFPFRGWTSQMLPGDPGVWCDSMGTTLMEKSRSITSECPDISPGKGWEWCSEWSVVPVLTVHGKKNVDGWEYCTDVTGGRFSTAVGIKESPWKTEKSTFSLIRRRKWQRIRRRIGLRRQLNKHVQSTNTVAESWMDVRESESVHEAAGFHTHRHTVRPKMTPQEAIRHQPVTETADSARLTARHFAAAGRWEEAAKRLTTAITIASKEGGAGLAAAYAERAEANIGLGNYSRALTDANYCTAIDPENPIGWRRKGEALVNLRQFAKAVSSLEKAVKYEPGDMSLRAILEAAQIEACL